MSSVSWYKNQAIDRTQMLHYTTIQTRGERQKVSSTRYASLSRFPLNYLHLRRETWLHAGYLPVDWVRHASRKVRPRMYTSAWRILMKIRDILHHHRLLPIRHLLGGVPLLALYVDLHLRMLGNRTSMRQRAVRREVRSRCHRWMLNGLCHEGVLTSLRHRRVLGSLCHGGLRHGWLCHPGLQHGGLGHLLR